MRGILHFIYLLLPAIKKTGDFLHAFIKILFPFEQYLILNVSVTPNFGLLNRYLYFDYISLTENCENPTALLPPSPLGALNRNKLLRKWTIGKEVAAILTKRFLLSLRNCYLTEMLQKANQPS